MSFQNLVLPDLLLAELYKNVHLTIDETRIQKRTESFESHPLPYKFLGNNEKRVTIIVRHPDDTFLPEKHLEFLVKILGACKLNIGHVAIINQASMPISIHQLLEQLQPKQMIMFGVEPTELKLPLSFPQFKLQLYGDTTYLYVPSLDYLNIDNEEGKLLKTKLWVCLKSLFDVNSIKP
jgi:hypothetical protein